MKQFARENSAAILLIALLVGVTSIATYWQLREEVDHPELATYSSQPDGSRALLLWGEALGYQTLTEPIASYAPPDTAALSFVLEPQAPGITESEWQTLDDWVQNGGVLILAGEGLGTALSMRRLSFDIDYVTDPAGDVVAASEEILPAAPKTLSNAQPQAVLRSEDSEHHVLFTVDGEAVVAALERGQGLIILTTLSNPFTNRGLKEPGNGEFVLSILSLVEPIAALWFDEWHHGVRSQAGAAAGPGRWLRNEPPGQALLYSFAVGFLWLLLSGQRFGRPVPLKNAKRRRAQVEHAVALANLSRRAGHRKAVADFYRSELKRKLGSRFGLSANLEDDEYLRRLEIVHPAVEREKLGKLLAELAREDLTDAQLLRIAQEVNEWTT